MSGSSSVLHGTTGEFTAHIGLCLTDDAEAANRYAARSTRRGTVYTIDIDMRGLRVGRVEVGFDESGAPGDSSEECAEYAEEGFDLIKFEDDAYGHSHTTWRMPAPPR